MKDKNFKYYVAYGSNLNIQKMHQRCPEVLVYATAILSGYKLVSNKVGNNAYLSIKKEKDSYVPVVVWKINKTQEKALDEYENFPNLYHKKELKLKVLLLKNNKHKKIKCFTYIMNEGYPEGKATKEYIDICMKGYKDFNFDQKILKKAFKI
ncbi:MAG: gamma-glutamylcyclotransferase [Acholeplasmataceae bacterium]|jgi:gamma-glutamylcyclotransferase (GGCT)/AIG2-like uncharacterized protein YtfP|nr:gamma-glutamylcyclotransferase [Acholeplasmataceae bacterium]